MPTLLDLYSGGGLAARGYAQAGWTVTGVDLKPMQAEYPYRFIRADALEYVAQHGHEYDAIHASPPCQAYSSATPDKSIHEDLIPLTRALLLETGRPWVMENVARAPMRADLMLCGTMFGLPLYRHRIFEANFPIPAITHDPHRAPVWYPYDKRRWAHGTKYREGWMIPVHGDNLAPARYQFRAMGVAPGTVSRSSLIQGIPPVFAEYIGSHLLAYVSSS